MAVLQLGGVVIVRMLELVQGIVSEVFEAHGADLLLL